MGLLRIVQGEVGVDRVQPSNWRELLLHYLFTSCMAWTEQSGMDGWMDLAQVEK